MSCTAALFYTQRQNKYKQMTATSIYFLPELTAPLAYYQNTDTANLTDSASTVIGGHVYRGSELPALTGLYIFGDFTDG